MPGLSDFGIMLEPQLGMTVQQIVQTATRAERLGFGYIFRSDHLLPTDNSRGKDSPECWTSLGAVAAATKKIKFGPMVTPLGFRNPALLARMACTLHSYSGGRLQLAIGAGWYEPEYRANGYDFPSFEVRKGQFLEGLSIILAMVREGKVDFHGKYFSAHTDCLPRPAGRTHLIIGTKTKSLIRVAAEKADEWNFFASPIEEFKPWIAIFRAAAESRKAEVSQMTPFVIGETRAELLANAKRQLDESGRKDAPEALLERLRRMGAPCGTTGEFSQQVGKLMDAGVQRLYFQLLIPENAGMTELLAGTLKRI